jgi:hypothetical protein
LTENSSWDERVLGEQLKVLSELELDFDLEATGFEIAEVDVLIDGLETLNEPVQTTVSPRLKPQPNQSSATFGSLANIVCFAEMR